MANDALVVSMVAAMKRLRIDLDLIFMLLVCFLIRLPAVLIGTPTSGDNDIGQSARRFLPSSQKFFEIVISLREELAVDALWLRFARGWLREMMLDTALSPPEFLHMHLPVAAAGLEVETQAIL